MAQLQTFCAGTACAYGQLSSGQGGVLKVIGLSTGDYAAYTVALMFASVVVCLVVSTLIVWRRPDDRMALLVALMLVTLALSMRRSACPLFPPPGRGLIKA